MNPRTRPLSPYLHYRWQYTNTLSLLHRLSGIALTGGFVVLVVALADLAQGNYSYTLFTEFLASLAGKGFIALELLAFAYHSCNGIRHLLWDAGWGFERAQARRSARWVVVASVLIAALCFAAAWVHTGTP
jgi:succinate dehydrogenase / fumarate reductase cytochrome b subunit